MSPQQQSRSEESGERRPVCFITGATGGLGTALAEQAAGKGLDLVLHGRAEPALVALDKRIRDTFPRISIELVVGDFDTAAGAHAVAGEVARRTPALDLLINNAGVLLRGVHLSPDGLEMHTQVNLIAPYVLMTELWPHVARVRGTIVNVSSGSALKAKALRPDLLRNPENNPGLRGAYATSKLALCAVTRALGREFHQRGVAIACANPGPVKTRMTSADGFPLLIRLLRPLLITTASVGASRVFASAERAGSHSPPGSVFYGSKAVRLPAFAESDDTARMLLEFCEVHAHPGS